MSSRFSLKRKGERLTPAIDLWPPHPHAHRSTYTQGLLDLPVQLVVWVSPGAPLLQVTSMSLRFNRASVHWVSPSHWSKRRKSYTGELLEIWALGISPPPPSYPVRCQTALSSEPQTGLMGRAGMKSWTLESNRSEASGLMTLSGPKKDWQYSYSHRVGLKDLHMGASQTMRLDHT